MPQIVNTNTPLSQVNIAAQKAKVIESFQALVDAITSDLTAKQTLYAGAAMHEAVAVKPAVAALVDPPRASSKTYEPGDPLPARLIERSDLPALRARWSDTVRYEIYFLLGDRRDLLAIEQAVFEMLMSPPCPAGDLREAHIKDMVCLVCEEYGGPPWFDWDEYVLLHPEYGDDYEEEEEEEEGEEDDEG
jgi:hypothetical protein